MCCLCVCPQEEYAPADQWPGGARRIALATGRNFSPGLGPGLFLHLERGGVDWKGITDRTSYATCVHAMFLTTDFSQPLTFIRVHEKFEMA